MSATDLGHHPHSMSLYKYRYIFIFNIYSVLDMTHNQFDVPLNSKEDEKRDPPSHFARSTFPAYLKDFSVFSWAAWESTFIDLFDYLLRMLAISAPSLLERIKKHGTRCCN